MTKRVLHAFAAATLSVSFLVAQSATPHTPPDPAQMVANRVSRLTTLLSLTTAQQTQATSIFTTAQAGLATIMTNMQAARTALQTAVKANNSAGIAAAAAEIGTLTTQQIVAQSTADAAFYAILTADQQTKLNELHAGGFGGPGFGRGPGGPRP